MSRSNPRPPDNPDVPAEYWIGYNTDKIPLQRQSKYDPDILSVPLSQVEVEDSDYKYNKWDLDEPELIK